MSGEPTARVSSSCRRLRIGRGVPPTDITEYQLLTSTPSMPCSANVGTSGMSGERFAAAAARILTRPDRASGSAAGGELIDDWIWPLTTSATEAPALF